MPLDQTNSPALVPCNPQHGFSDAIPVMITAQPDHFGVDPVVKNAFEAETLADVTRDTQKLAALKELARQNMLALFDIFARLPEKPALHLVLKAVAGLVDQVYTADPAFSYIGPDGQAYAYISCFKFSQRQPEAGIMEQVFLAAGFKIRQIDEGTFEGLGESRFCGAYGPNGTVFASHGVRGSAEGVDQLERFLKEDLGDRAPTVFRMELKLHAAEDQEFFHLDCAFAALSDGTIIIHREAFTEETLQRFDAMMGGQNSEQYKAKVIEIPRRMARGYATNLRQSESDIVGTPAFNETFEEGPFAGKTLREVVEARNFQVKTANVKAFLDTGGGVSCLTQEVMDFRKRKDPGFCVLPTPVRDNVAALASHPAVAEVHLRAA